MITLDIASESFNNLDRNRGICLVNLISYNILTRVEERCRRRQCAVHFLLNLSQSRMCYVRDRRYEESYWCARIARTRGRNLLRAWGWNVEHHRLLCSHWFLRFHWFSLERAGKLDTMMPLGHFSLKQLSRVTNKIRSDTYRWHASLHDHGTLFFHQTGYRRLV